MELEEEEYEKLMLVDAAKQAGMNAPEHQHQWGMWLGYDPMMIDTGFTNGFCYRRECMVFGCNAKQRVEHLEPAGKLEDYHD